MTQAQQRRTHRTIVRLRWVIDYLKFHERADEAAQLQDAICCLHEVLKSGDERPELIARISRLDELAQDYMQAAVDLMETPGLAH